LARGAALRFLLTRLVDWLDVPPGALVRPKDPIEYLRKLRFHQKVTSARDYGVDKVSDQPPRLPLVRDQLLHVAVHTDGGCSPNPGPGGWAAILAFPDHEVVLTGGEAYSTNNRMELMAAISALESLKLPCSVDLYTDSQYLQNGITTWIANWKRNGWRTADKNPVKNVELWRRLDATVSPHRIRWHWVPGHSGHDVNERADALVQQAIAEIRKAGRGGQPKN